MNKKIKAIIFELGLDYKKEISKFSLYNVLFLLAAVAVIIINPTVVLIVVFLAVFLILNYFLLTKYSSLMRKEKQRRIDEFIHVFTYFQMYIENHQNIYQSLKAIVSFSSPWMGEKIEKLLTDIDEDKTIAPFVSFAKLFDSLMVEQVMMSIYQMVDQDISSMYFIQFSALFSKFSTNRALERFERKKRGMDILNTLPLVASFLVTIILIACVFLTIGEFINGI